MLDLRCYAGYDKSFFKLTVFNSTITVVGSTHILAIDIHNLSLHGTLNKETIDLNLIDLNYTEIELNIAPSICVLHATINGTDIKFPFPLMELGKILRKNMIKKLLNGKDIIENNYVLLPFCFSDCSINVVKVCVEDTDVSYDDISGAIKLSKEHGIEFGYDLGYNTTPHYSIVDINCIFLRKSYLTRYMPWHNSLEGAVKYHLEWCSPFNVYYFRGVYYSQDFSFQTTSKQEALDYLSLLKL